MWIKCWVCKDWSLVNELGEEIGEITWKPHDLVGRDAQFFRAKVHGKATHGFWYSDRTEVRMPVRHGG